MNLAVRRDRPIPLRTKKLNKFAKTNIFFLLLIFPIIGHAIVSIGGYVPFGPATQKEADGKRNTTTYHPMLGLNGIIPIMNAHLFMPEGGAVFHRNQFDEVSKKTLFLLLDFGYVCNQEFVLRYGLGSFLTKIGGDGGLIAMPNGSSTLNFAKPDHTSTSYNTTIDFGLDYGINKNYSLKLEGFIFSLLNSQSRKLSYALTFNYYLD